MFRGGTRPPWQLMRKNPTRTLSMGLGEGLPCGDGVGVGLATGLGLGLGKGLIGLGLGLGLGLGVGLGLGKGLTGLGLGLGLGLGVGKPLGDAEGLGLTGVPVGFVPGTRMAPGRVGSSSVTVQPQPQIRANTAIQSDILMAASPRNDLRGSHLN